MSDTDNAVSEITDEELDRFFNPSTRQFSPQFLGLRAAVLELSRQVVVSIFEPSGRVDEEPVAQLKDYGELRTQAVMLVVDAMCHAINAGIDPGLLQQIAMKMDHLCERHPFDFAINLKPLGLHVEQPPRLQYVLGDDNSPEVVMMVRPGLRSKVIPVSELAEMVNGRSKQ